MAKNLSSKVAKSMFLDLLPAQILAVAVLNINSLLNSILIGNLMGTDCLAVFGFMVPLNCLHTMIGGGIASGAQILCGRYIGSGDRKGMRHTYAATFVLCVFFGLLLTAVYQFFPVQIASLLGASGETLKTTSDYLRGYGWGVVFMMLSSSMIPFLQLNNASITMNASIGTLTASNVALNLLSILVFKGGMRSVGLSSAAAYLLSNLVVVGYFFSRKCPIRFSLRDFSMASVKNIFQMGLPSITKPLFLCFRNLIFNNVAVRVGGTIAVTAMAIYGNVGLFVDAFGDGICNAINMIASIFYGERDKESLREVSPIGWKIGTVIQYSIYVIIFIFATPLAHLFGAKDALIPAAVAAMRIGFLYLIFNIATNAIYSTYKGIGKTAMINLFNFVNFFVIPVPLCLLLSRLFGINGVWLTFAVPEPICLIGFLIYSVRMRKQPLKKLSDMTYIPEGFGLESSDRCDAVIRTSEDASKASARAIEFCRSKGLDEKKSRDCGLCIEEMAVAILEHGMESAHRRSSSREIDLRMIYENDGITIMLRDNYPKFDPVDWMRLHEPEDPMRYIGIRTVIALAKEVNYSTALNLNVLTLRV